MKETIINVMSTAITTIGNAIVSWFIKLNGLTKKFGFKHVLMTMGIIALGFFMFEVGSVMHRVLSQQEVIERLYKEKQQEEKKHEIGTEIRKKNSPKIRTIMTKMLYQMDANRVCIMEFHNGKSNGTGLPFYYGDVTMEESIDNNSFQNELKDLNLANYPHTTYLSEKRFFVGTIDEFKEIDKKMGLRMECDGVKYLCMVLLKTNVEIGIVSITYNEIPNIPKNEFYPKLIDYVQDINYLLDYSHNT